MRRTDRLYGVKWHKITNQAARTEGRAMCEELYRVRSTADGDAVTLTPTPWRTLVDTELGGVVFPASCPPCCHSSRSCRRVKRKQLVREKRRERKKKKKNDKSRLRHPRSHPLKPLQTILCREGQAPEFLLATLAANRFGDGPGRYAGLWSWRRLHCATACSRPVAVRKKLCGRLVSGIHLILQLRSLGIAA